MTNNGWSWLQTYILYKFPKGCNPLQTKMMPAQLKSDDESSWKWIICESNHHTTKQPMLSFLSMAFQTWIVAIQRLVAEPNFSELEDMCPFVHDVNEVKGKNHMFTFYLEQTTYWDYSTKNWEQYQKALQLVVVGHLWEGVKSHELSRPYAKKNT